MLSSSKIELDWRKVFPSLFFILWQRTKKYNVGALCGFFLVDPRLKQKKKNCLYIHSNGSSVYGLPNVLDTNLPLWHRDERRWENQCLMQQWPIFPAAQLDPLRDSDNTLLRQSRRHANPVSKEHKIILNYTSNRTRLILDLYSTSFVLFEHISYSCV